MRVEPGSYDFVVWPDQIVLHQNYPAPFNLSTQIQYLVGNPSRVSLKIYSLTGGEITTLVNGYQESGEKFVIWDGRDNLGRVVPSGLCLFKIEAGSAMAVRKMCLLK